MKFQTVKSGFIVGRSNGICNVDPAHPGLPSPGYLTVAGLFSVSVQGVYHSTDSSKYSPPYINVPTAHPYDVYVEGQKVLMGFINPDAPVIISRGFSKYADNVKPVPLPGIPKPDSYPPGTSNSDSPGRLWVRIVIDYTYLWRRATKDIDRIEFRMLMQGLSVNDSISYTYTIPVGDHVPHEQMHIDTIGVVDLDLYFCCFTRTTAMRQYWTSLKGWFSNWWDTVQSDIADNWETWPLTDIDWLYDIYTDGIGEDLENNW